jgi:hypothetical protein
MQRFACSVPCSMLSKYRILRILACHTRPMIMSPSSWAALQIVRQFHMCQTGACQERRTKSRKRLIILWLPGRGGANNPTRQLLQIPRLKTLGWIWAKPESVAGGVRYKHHAGKNSPPETVFVTRNIRVGRNSPPETVFVTRNIHVRRNSPPETVFVTRNIRVRRNSPPETVFVTRNIRVGRNSPPETVFVTRNIRVGRNSRRAWPEEGWGGARAKGACRKQKGGWAGLRGPCITIINAPSTTFSLVDGAFLCVECGVCV